MEDQEIIDKANELARRFYKIHGYNVKKGYRFDKATHPQERMIWDLASEAFDMLKNTDIEDALSSLDK